MADGTNGQDARTNQELAGAPDTPGQEPTGQEPGSENKNEGGVTFDGWFNEQPEEVRSLVSSHISGLKNAHEAQKAQRNELKKDNERKDRQIAELSKLAEKGSELSQKIVQMETENQQARQKIAFVEEAVSQRVTKPHLAWLAAQDSDLIDSRGRVDWDSFRSLYPELIEKPAVQTARSNAGSGTGSPPVRPVDMNDRIRNMAGRR